MESVTFGFFLFICFELLTDTLSGSDVKYLLEVLAIISFHFNSFISHSIDHTHTLN